LERFGKVWKDFERLRMVWNGPDMLDRFGWACGEFACDCQTDCVTDNVSTRDATHLKIGKYYMNTSYILRISWSIDIVNLLTKFDYSPTNYWLSM
jgi:hypothetical protein